MFRRPSELPPELAPLAELLAEQRQRRFALRRRVGDDRGVWRRVLWPVLSGFTGWVARQGWRHRRRLAPPYTAALVWVAAWVLSLPGDGLRTALVVGAAGAGFLAWRYRRRRWSHWRVAYVASAYGFAWAVAGFGSVVGAGPPIPGLLILATVAWGIPWWYHYRIRPLPPIDQAVAAWELRVGAEGKALPGSWIENPQPVIYAPPAPLCPECGGHGFILEATPNGKINTRTTVPCKPCDGSGRKAKPTPAEVGWQAAGGLPPGDLTFKDALRAVERIASAFSVPLPSVAIEAARDGRYDRFRLAIYRDNPLRTVRHFPGPTPLDLAVGTSCIGFFIDQLELLYRWFEPNSGAVHDLIAGTTGAGKSRLLDMLLAYERAWGFISIVIDPQSGASMPDWQDSVAHFARSADEGVATLLQVEQELLERGRKLGSVEWVDERGRNRKGIDHFDLRHPAIQQLGLKFMCVTVDEAHAVLLDDQALRAAEAIAKMGRKCGIKLRLVVQVPTIDQLGDSGTLRSLVKSGNIIVFRTADAISGQVAFDGVLPVDPVELPRRWNDGSPTAGICFVLGDQARTVMARTFLTADPYGYAHAGQTTYIEWPKTVEPPPSPPDGGGGDGASVGDGSPPEPVTVPTGTARDRIVAYLRQQRRGQRYAETKTGVIAEALGLELNTTSKALGVAKISGQVRSTKRGWWVAADATNEAKEAEAHV